LTVDFEIYAGKRQTQKYRLNPGAARLLPIIARIAQESKGLRKAKQPFTLSLASVLFVRHSCDASSVDD
jgi:hypothetical protein